MTSKMSSSPSIGSTSVSSRVRSVARWRFQVESAAENRKLFIEIAWVFPGLSSLPLLNSRSALWFASTSSFCSSVTTTGSANALTIHQSHSFSIAWASPPWRNAATSRACASRLPAWLANGASACTSASLAGVPLDNSTTPIGGWPDPRSGATTNASKPSSVKTSREVGLRRSSEATSSTRWGTPVWSATTDGSCRLASGTWNASAIWSAIPRPKRPRRRFARSSDSATSDRS